MELWLFGEGKDDAMVRDTLPATESPQVQTPQHLRCRSPVMCLIDVFLLQELDSLT